MPLNLTGEYVHPGPGEYATVLIRLNGQPLVCLESDFVPEYHSDMARTDAVNKAIEGFVAELIANVATAVPA
jgi:hypothetical protein